MTSTPEIKFWDYRNYPDFTGEYIGRFDGIGKFRNTIFMLRSDADGKKYGIWGTTYIRQALVWATPGDRYKIHFKGEGPSAKTGRNQFVFDVRPLKSGERDEKPRQPQQKRRLER